MIFTTKEKKNEQLKIKPNPAHIEIAKLQKKVAR